MTSSAHLRGCFYAERATGKNMQVSGVTNPERNVQNLYKKNAPIFHSASKNVLARILQGKKQEVTE